MAAENSELPLVTQQQLALFLGEHVLKAKDLAFSQVGFEPATLRLKAEWLIGSSCCKHKT